MTTERLTLVLICDYFKTIGFSQQTISVDNGNAIMLSLGHMDVGVILTICDVDGKDVLKIDELFVTDFDRNKGIGTSILSLICMICEECKCEVGLWTRGDSYLDKWYSKFGFDLIEINKHTSHYWYEKSRPTTSKYLKKKLGNEYHSLQKLRPIIRNKFMVLQIKSKFADITK